MRIGDTVVVRHKDIAHPKSRAAHKNKESIPMSVTIALQQQCLSGKVSEHHE